MYWLNLDWIVSNWMPLAAFTVVGFILGWLLTGLSPPRRAREYEARMTELESKYRKADRDLADLRHEKRPAARTPDRLAGRPGQGTARQSRK